MILSKPKIIKTNIYLDKRGSLQEVYKQKNFDTNFKFILTTKSKKYVFRGFHLQTKFSQTKIIYLNKGKILDIVIDLRKNSKNLKKIYKFIMNAGDLLFIPAGFAHGYYTYHKENYITYIMNNYQYRKYERGVSIFDPIFKFKFKKKMIISLKDTKWPFLNEFIEKNL